MAECVSSALLAQGYIGADAGTPDRAADTRCMVNYSRGDAVASAKSTFNRSLIDQCATELIASYGISIRASGSFPLKIRVLSDASAWEVSV
jgi:hypothetical protein